MNKQEFLAELRNRLEGAPKDEIEEQIEFYGEMIDDRIEEGMTEEQAILELGPMDDIVSCVLSEIPFAEIAKDRLRPKRSMKAWEIVLLIVGAPVWRPLLIALFAIELSLYVSLWAVIISFWSVFVSLGACAVGLVVSSVALAWGGNDLSGLAVLGEYVYDTVSCDSGCHLGLCLKLALLTEKLDCSIHITVSLNKCLLALHHADTGLCSESSNVFCCNSSHFGKFLSYIVRIIFLKIKRLISLA